MISTDDLFHVGFISKTHGYSGYFYLSFVSSFFPSDKLKGFVFLMINEKAVPFYIENCLELTDKYALIKIEDLNTKEDIAAYSGLKVYLEKKLWQDCLNLTNISPTVLTGFKLLDVDHKIVGTVTNVTASPAHYLLELNNESLVPLHNDLIISIDENNKTIIMDLPEGLL